MKITNSIYQRLRQAKAPRLLTLGVISLSLGACVGGTNSSPSSEAVSSSSLPTSSSSIVSSSLVSSSIENSSTESSSSLPSSSSIASTSSISSPAMGTMIDATIEAEDLNPDISDSYQIESQPSGVQNVGFIEVGSYICYDDIDLTGVKSVDIAYARDQQVVATLGKVALLWGSGDLEQATPLGEKYTPGTSGWTNFQPLNIGLATEVNNVGTLCIRGMQGNGIANIDSFTLRATAGENDGITDLTFEAPVGPAIPPVTTEGNKVLFGGEHKAIAGNSFFWSAGPFSADIFFNADIVKWLKDDWGSQIVRAALAVDDNKPDGKPIDELKGYITHPIDNLQRVETVVNAAIENGMYVIIDWHAHKAEDFESEAIAFFQDMAAKYGTYNNVIYEVYNEPVDTSWPQIKAYAENVIAAIRAIDPDNLIIVGTRFYSQEVEEAADDPITSYDNIAYTLHFYAATHGDSLRQKASRALAKGIPLIVTEWGTTDASGQGAFNGSATDAWVTWLRENKITHLNWAINDDNQGTSIANKGSSTFGGWSDNDLSPSGRYVKDLIKNWDTQ